MDHRGGILRPLCEKQALDLDYAKFCGSVFLGVILIVLQEHTGLLDIMAESCSSVEAPQMVY